MAAPRENVELTTAELNLLAKYREHTDKYGVSPTIRGLARELGVYANSVRHIIKRLQLKGYIQAEEHQVTLTRLRINLTPKGRRKVGS